MAKMSDPPKSIKYKMLIDAGFNDPEMYEYVDAVDFIKRVAEHSCCLCQSENCLRCDAVSLLREWGEI